MSDREGAAASPPWLAAGSPHEAAYWFHQAVLSGRAREAWHALTATYRQRLATNYVEAANDELAADAKLLDPEALAAALADADCDQEWWLDGICQSFRGFFPSDWAWSSDPRPIALDTEAVVCFDARELDLDTDGRARQGFVATGSTLYMERDTGGRWRVASVNEPPAELA